MDPIVDPVLLQAGITTRAKFLEVYGFHYDDNNTLEIPPSSAHTGNQATMAHHGDFNSLMEGVESWDPWLQTFTDGGYAFWKEFVLPTFEQPKVEIVWGEEPQYSDLEEEEVSVEETDSEEDRRPARSAWKRPVDDRRSVPAGSVEAQGKQPSSDAVPHADSPERQQDEDDEEFEGDDDEYERPARLSGTPAPTISSRKASAWSDDEDAACIKFMKEVCTLAQYAAIAGTEKRFEVVADRMKREAGFNRTASGVKLQWNRRLRAASGFEDRGEKKRAPGLTTSALGQGTKRGTSAVTSLVSSTSRGRKSSATSAQSTETSSLSSRKGKRKATIIDSDDEADDEDFLSSSRPYPAKRPRIGADISSSALPSTQDVAYYDLSTANILSGPRASRNRPAATAQAATTTTAATPRRSSRPQPTTTINDDDDDDDADDEEEAPEPNYNSLSYWQEVLRKRQARVAEQREEYEREQQQEDEAEDEDEEEEPVITTADRARKSRAMRSRAARFDLSPIAEDDEQPVNITPATAAQIAADEEIARQLQEEWNEAPATRARRGRGFR
ncbi:hypothetical protein KCU65_g6560, partial [Aureobasidium melanogenum]